MTNSRGGMGVPCTTANPLLDRRGWRRSHVTLPEYRRGQPAPNRGRRFPPEPLTQQEALRLIEACACGRPSPTHPYGHPTPACTRNRALIVVLWRAGLRLGETLALYPKDVDLERGAIHVLHGKGDQDRWVGLDRTGGTYVQAWLVQRQRLGFTGAQALFCVIAGPSRGLAMRPSYVRELLRDLAVKARIFKRVHPHSLRHTCAAELGDENVPVHYIRRHLGHSSLEITARYMDHLRPGEVIEVLQAREWPEAA